MKNGILLLIGLFLFSCSDKNENKPEKLKRYIISSENKKEKKRLTEANIPPPPKSFYGSNNILFANGNFYYYQRYNPWNCIVDKSDTVPSFINLDPIQLIKIPKEQVWEFVLANLSHLEPRRKIIIIGTQRDTINDKDFIKFIDSVGHNIPTWIVRRTTQEEDTVLKYKRNNDYYNPNSIKWDRTKIKFH